MNTHTFQLGLVLILLQLKTFSQLSFTLTYLSLNTSITCVNPSVVVQAQSNYAASTINYSVFPSAGSQSASVFAFTTASTYTVTGSAPGQGNFTATISVSQNTTAPISTLTPLYQSITCNNPAVQTITGTALNPTVNVYHQFNFSNGLVVGPIAGNTATLQPPPGTHTHVVTNAINGCSVAKTFTVASGPGFPTFTLASPIQNFSVGCAPKHTVAVVIQNAQSDPIGLPVTYSILPVNSYTLNAPGIYTVVVKDMSTGCETKSPFSINQNIQPPNLFLSAPIQTLSCLVPSATLTASSNNNVSYTWHYLPTGFAQGSVFTASISSTPSHTFLGNYSLTALDLNNACKSVTVFPMYQNIFPPNAAIGGTNTPLTCTSSVILTNLSTSSIPPNVFNNSLPVIVTQWAATNQASLVLSNTYTASSHGAYTMQIQDSNNGCVSSATALLSFIGQSITLSASQSYSISCTGNNTLSINSIVSNFTSCTYTWSNSNGTIASGTLSANSGTANVSLQVNSPNYYTLTVQDGNCISKVTMPVYACVGIGEGESGGDLISIYPNPSSAHFEVLLKENINYPVLIEVYNSLSQKVKTQEITSLNTLISIDSAPGVYFISISKEGHCLHYSKLLKN